MTPKKSYSQLVPAVDEAARILFFMASRAGRELNLTAICEGVGVQKPKGLSILNTLAAHGLAHKDEALKTWSLGVSLLTLSHAVLENGALGAQASPYLRKLADASQGAALLGIVSGEHLIIVAREERQSFLGVTIRTGQRYPLDWGAHGELFASHTGETGTERRTGKRFCVDIGKMQRGINAVAAAVYGRGVKPVGCILVVGTFPEAEANDLGELAAKAAEELSDLYGAAIENAGGAER